MNEMGRTVAVACTGGRSYCSDCGESYRDNKA